MPDRPPTDLIINILILRLFGASRARWSWVPLGESHRKGVYATIQKLLPSSRAILVECVGLLEELDNFLSFVILEGSQLLTIPYRRTAASPRSPSTFLFSLQPGEALQEYNEDMVINVLMMARNSHDSMSTCWHKYASQLKWNHVEFCSLQNSTAMETSLWNCV